MAGRKPLALTNLDYLAIVRHVNDLPFKRKCEAELLSIFDAEKHHISALTTNELAVLKNVDMNEMRT